MSKTERFNIMIVDDHPVFRTGLKNILRKLSFVGKIFEAGSGQEAVDLVKKNTPVQVIMMDIDMPGMNGIEATYSIRELNASIRVISLTMFCEPKMIYGMVKSGVKGYLLKDATMEEIRKAIMMVRKNEEYYSDRVQSILVRAVRDYDKLLPQYNPNLTITPHQVEILRMLCNQKSSDEISEALEISTHTVNRHRQELLDRTGSRNLAGLVIYAIEHGILKVNIRS